MKNSVLLIAFCFIWVAVLGQQPECECILFYNVENLFDTKNDPLKLDDEFTPQGSKHWTASRYMTKVRKLAEAIKVVGGEKLPMLIGLAEIENRRVLNDLISKTQLVDGGYEVIHKESPDPRGIDVALLYRNERIQLLKSVFYRPKFKEDTTIKTRDVLYAKMLFQQDTLHFFVCHFPSMVGGEKQSEWKRCRVAELVRSKVDSLFQQDVAAKILIMGDLNGKSNTLAQRKLLKSSGVRGGDKGNVLINIGHYLLNKRHLGSYRYQGNWQTIDHIIVSSAFLNAKSGGKIDKQMYIGTESSLLEEDRNYFGYKPWPTYRGMRYLGGVSDHLPVYTMMYINGK